MGRPNNEEIVPGRMSLGGGGKCPEEVCPRGNCTKRKVVGENICSLSVPDCSLSEPDQRTKNISSNKNCEL